MPTTVYFASNRVLTGAPDAVASYSGDLRDPSQPTELTYATAFVDGIDIEGDKQGRIASIQNAAQGAFAANVLGDLATPGRNLLVFIHGFANSFEDAITRAAYNREFLAASGEKGTDTSVIAFSWPSAGKTFGFPIPTAAYTGDQHMARHSGLHVMTFLANLEPILTAARKAGSKCFLLAHSMGNLALESAVYQWFQHGNGTANLFDLAILAAGDCDYDALIHPAFGGLSGLPRLTQRISVYYSGEDEVLDISKIVNLGAQRLGQDGPLHRTDTTLYPQASFTMNDCTACRDFDDGFLASHQYYRRSPEVRARIAADMGAATP